MNRSFRILMTLALLLLAGSMARAQQPDAVSRAMKDELARSMEKLRLANLEKPYFVAYRVDDARTANISATLGSLTGSGMYRNRHLSIEMRVGDYALDNTNFMALGSSPFSMMAGSSGLTLDDDYDQIRREIWLATDRAYKAAAKAYAAKRSVLEHRQSENGVADFTPEPPTKVEEAPSNLKIDVAALEQVATRISAVFRSDSQVYSSGVEIVVRDGYTRYLNSEGTWFTRSEPLVVMNVAAELRAKDGMPLRDSFQVFARDTEAVQDPQLVTRAESLLQRLQALRNAPATEAYSGPVLFEDNAAGEALAQVLAPALVASRFPVTDQPQFEAQFQQVMAQFGGTSLSDRIGSRVLPSGFDLADEPRTTTFSGTSLLGSYAIDDDGVPTREVKLVDHGILKAVLSTRVPTPDTKASTGSRRLLGASPSNLVLTARDTMPAEALKNDLLKMVKERGLAYGIIVRRVGPAGLSWLMRMASMKMRGGGVLPMASEVYRVYPDGHEELVSRAEIQPVTAAAFKDIIAAGDHPIVYNGIYIPLAGSIFGAIGGARGAEEPTIVSYVTPSLLFDDISIKASSAPIPNPPLTPSPLLAAAAK